MTPKLHYPHISHQVIPALLDSGVTMVQIGKMFIDIRVATSK
ncbi:MAG: hypothetical protein ACLQUZ_04340 [Rhizomicrobium sp.]